MSQNHTNMAASPGARSIERAWEVLDLLSSSEDGLSLSELCRQVRLPKSTVHRILGSLESRHLVRQNPVTGTYALGFGLLKYSSSLIERLDVRNVIHPYLDSLRHELNETVHLGFLDSGYTRVVYIDKLDSTKSVRMVSHVGKAVPVHCTALGKALLAQFSNTTVSKLLADYEFTTYSPNTIADLQAFLKNLDEVRSEGFAIDNQEHDRDVSCIATLIRSPAGHSRFAISVSAPAERLDVKSFARVADVLLRTRQEIEKQVGDLPLDDNA